MFRDSSSAGNPGYHWIIGLKIKSYYQTLPFWWRLNEEKAVLFCKKYWPILADTPCSTFVLYEKYALSSLRLQLYD